MNNSKRLFFILLVFTGFFSGCSTDLDDELSIMGSWVEEAPVKDRTLLYFHRLDRVTKTHVDESLEAYRYKIEDKSIFLRAEGKEEEDSRTELFFKRIDKNTFQVENMHPSIPEVEPTYMIFKRG